MNFVSFLRIWFVAATQHTFTFMNFYHWLKPWLQRNNSSQTTAYEFSFFFTLHMKQILCLRNADNFQHDDLTSCFSKVTTLLLRYWTPAPVLPQPTISTVDWALSHICPSSPTVQSVFFQDNKDGDVCEEEEDLVGNRSSNSANRKRQLWWESRQGTDEKNVRESQIVTWLRKMIGHVVIILWCTTWMPLWKSKTKQNRNPLFEEAHAGNNKHTVLYL